MGNAALRLPALIALAILLLCASGAGAGTSTPAPGLERHGAGAAAPEYVPGEVIVRFRAGTTTAARRSSLASTEGQVAQSLGLAGATFRFTSLQAGSKFECRHMSGPWMACTSPRTYRSLALGSHTFRVRAIDPSGNIDATPAVRTWRINRP